MNQDQRGSVSFFLIVNTYAVNVSKTTVRGVREVGANFFKRNVCGTREPKDSQRDRDSQHQQQESLE